MVQRKRVYECKYCGDTNVDNFYKSSKYTCKECVIYKMKQKPYYNIKENMDKATDRYLEKHSLPQRDYNKERKQVPKGIKDEILNEKFKEVVALVDEQSYIRYVGKTPYGVLIDKDVVLPYTVIKAERNYISVYVRLPKGSHVGTTSIGRFILGVTDPSIHVDHINHNTLDNRRCNLRETTRSQNGTNKKALSGKQSNIYKGVYTNHHLVTATVHKEGINYSSSFGREVNEYIASIMVDTLSEIYHGEYGWLNNSKEILDMPVRDLFKNVFKKFGNVQNKK